MTRKLEELLNLAPSDNISIEQSTAFIEKNREINSFFSQRNKKISFD
jgi:hypothetical protein